MLNYRLIDPLKRSATSQPLTERQIAARERFLEALLSNKIRLESVETCPCGGTDFFQLADRDRFGLQFGAFLCMNCGLVLTIPMIAEDSLNAYYAEYYHDLHFPASYDGETALYKEGQGSKIFRVLRPMLPSKDNLRILDVGAGTGSVALEFLESASQADVKATATVLEYNEKIRHRFRDKRAVEVIVGGLEDLQGCDKKYDIVIMSHVLEHFRDIGKQLSYLTPHVTDESLVYVEVPGLFRLKYSCEYNCDFLRYFTSAHMYHFNFTSLSYIMSMAGFRPLWGNEVVEAVYTKGVTSLDTRTNASDVQNYLAELERSLVLYQTICELQNRVSQLEGLLAPVGTVWQKLARYVPISVLRFCYKRFSKIVGSTGKD